MHISDVMVKLQEEKVRLAVSVKEAQENQRRYIEKVERLKIVQDVNNTPPLANQGFKAGDTTIQVRSLTLTRIFNSSPVLLGEDEQLENVQHVLLRFLS